MKSGNGWQMASKWLEDGWKIALSDKLSSSPYPIHHQPVTPFLEDMADFFTYKLNIMLTIGGYSIRAIPSYGYKKRSSKSFDSEDLK